MEEFSRVNLEGSWPPGSDKTNIRGRCELIDMFFHPGEGQIRGKLKLDPKNE